MRATVTPPGYSSPGRTSGNTAMSGHPNVYARALADAEHESWQRSILRRARLDSGSLLFKVAEWVAG